MDFKSLRSDKLKLSQKEFGIDGDKFIEDMTSAKWSTSAKRTGEHPRTLSC